MVGCVIVVNSQIIGEGYTSTYGGPHAEVNAIGSVKDLNLLKKATLYVTLEPCSHQGKTPPCSDLILKHKIPKVVIGCIDPHKKVRGKGIERLRAHGCEVLVGIEEALCRKHHKRFLTYHTKKRPYIILKWAETKNGFVAPFEKNEKRPFWISGKLSRQLVHQWRAEEQAVLVGANTVIQDNPRLTTRHVNGKNPTRVVLTKSDNLSKKYAIFNKDAETITINIKSLKPNSPLVNQICNELYNKKITSLIVEGGPKTIQLFIDENLWDEARIFKASQAMKDGIKAPKLLTNNQTAMVLGNDQLYFSFNEFDSEQS